MKKPKRISLRPDEYPTITDAYLAALGNDELLQVYVIAGTFFAIAGFAEWEKPWKHARTAVLARMRDAA